MFDLVLKRHYNLRGEFSILPYDMKGVHLMAQTITLELPIEMLRRYQRGAAVARKGLEEFLANYLRENPPPLASDLPDPLQKDLEALENLNDEALWKVARSKLPADDQRLYSYLLHKNTQGNLTPREEEKLHILGEKSRLLTLKKAHAFMLLKWRGHQIPAVEDLTNQS